MTALCLGMACTLHTSIAAAEAAVDGLGARSTRRRTRGLLRRCVGGCLASSCLLRA